MTHTPLRLALAAVALTGLAACNPMTGPTSSSPTTVKPTEASAYEGRVLTLVNVERTKAHLRPLVLANCVDGFANSWAATMARTGTFAHQNMMPILVACKGHSDGENIGTGAVTADVMMTAWMNSPDHRANILNPRFTTIGVGAVKTSAGRWYSVQDFMAP